jgi:hypothetical protein
LAEWRAAVSAADGVRLSLAQAHTVTNPKTGEVISIAKRDGDAEVLFPDDKKWYSVFRWCNGSAAFAARFQPGDKSNPVWVTAVLPAKHLTATIRGDNGETYDLESGKVVRS